MTTSPHRSGADDELTIDELAAKVGLTVRTVRFYAGKRLLPPPRLEGRTGFYGPQHVARLSLVRDLQQTGYNLAAIEQLLTALPEDADPLAIDMYGSLLVPWVPQEALVLAVDELADRLNHTVDDSVLELLQAANVLTIRGNNTVEITQRQLEFAKRVLELQAPLDALVEGNQIVRHHTAQIAEKLQQVFLERIAAQFDEANPESREHLRAIAATLRPVTIQSIVTAYQEFLEQAVHSQAPSRTGTSGQQGGAAAS